MIKLNRLSEFVRKVVLISSVITLGAIFSLNQRIFANTTQANEPVCSGLTSQLSLNKDYYIFTALSSNGNTGDINSYNFNFGDGSSYTLNYPKTSSIDRSQAIVTHTYENNGDYTASVTIYSSSGGGREAISSPACTTQVSIGTPSSAQLANTGAGEVIGVFLAASFLSAVSCRLYLLNKKLV